MSSRTTIALDYYLMYKNKRDRLKDFLKTCQRVSVENNTWSSFH